MARRWKAGKERSQESRSCEVHVWFFENSGFREQNLVRPVETAAVSWQNTGIGGVHVSTVKDCEN
jgi:hypothetical protein